VASPLLRRLLELRDLLVGWSVMVQREVAGRLVASPGTRDYGSLTVLHQLVAKVERAGDVHPRCFWPVPEVTSAFVRVEPLPGAPGADELAAVERLARAGFAHRRKTLANSLAIAGLASRARVEEALGAIGRAAQARAEELEPGEFVALAAALG
jgi:16S rRNA (adenine1518-N6/adenine1519-N6)-dimethyltransferase